MTVWGNPPRGWLTREPDSSFRPLLLQAIAITAAVLPTQPITSHRGMPIAAFASGPAARWRSMPSRPLRLGLFHFRFSSFLQRRQKAIGSVGGTEQAHEPAFLCAAAGWRAGGRRATAPTPPIAALWPLSCPSWAVPRALALHHVKYCPAIELGPRPTARSGSIARSGSDAPAHHSERAQLLSQPMSGPLSMTRLPFGRPARRAPAGGVCR
jgi:hypothetical protein